MGTADTAQDSYGIGGVGYFGHGGEPCPAISVRAIEGLGVVSTSLSGKKQVCVQIPWTGGYLKIKAWPTSDSVPAAAG